jgi:hypothetical protein|tara:strand:- start:347 stop:787 length:441 start_codon:yes stop_codon:yes gene_type:complete
MRRFTYKGKYNPTNGEKYVGNTKNIVYRSMWERRFMKYCDENPEVLSWSSEELVIPYLSPVDRKLHRYFPDFLIKVKRGDKTQTIVIEVKPKKETKPPKKKKTITPRYLYEMKTWSVNEAKWKAANTFCLDRKWEFKIITEDQVGR